MGVGAWPVWTPGAWFAGLMLLHTKYISSGPYVFREEDFWSFSHFKSMEANESRGVANLDPKDMVGRIYVGDHLTLLHIKYLSSGSYGLRREDFWIFFSL